MYSTNFGTRTRVGSGYDTFKFGCHFRLFLGYATRVRATKFSHATKQSHLVRPVLLVGEVRLPVEHVRRPVGQVRVHRRLRVRVRGPVRREWMGGVAGVVLLEASCDGPHLGFRSFSVRQIWYLQYEISLKRQ